MLVAKQHEHDREAEVRAAVNRVLNAERDVERSIVECRRKAEEILEAARKRARDIARRAEQRIADVHARCARATDTALTDLETKASRLQACDIIDEPDKISVRSAVERMAARLTSSDDEQD